MRAAIRSTIEGALSPPGLQQAYRIAKLGLLALRCIQDLVAADALEQRCGFVVLFRQLARVRQAVGGLRLRDSPGVLQTTGGFILRDGEVPKASGIENDAEPQMGVRAHRFRHAVQRGESFVGPLR